MIMRTSTWCASNSPTKYPASVSTPPSSSGAPLLPTSARIRLTVLSRPGLLYWSFRKGRALFACLCSRGSDNILGHRALDLCSHGLCLVDGSCRILGYPIRRVWRHASRRAPYLVDDLFARAVGPRRQQHPVILRRQHGYGLSQRRWSRSEECACASAAAVIPGCRQLRQGSERSSICVRTTDVCVAV
jgi:hypothetical protein